MRKLASVQVVEEVNKHPNADALDIVKVLGWRCVAKLGEFKVGDKVIYCEVDSVLPEKPEFEFLRTKKFRIRTIKLRGAVSQGICFPMSFLPEGNYEVDQEVTELMGITKFDPEIHCPNPMSVGGNPKGNFPSFLQKTDETRIQSCMGKLKNNIPENIFVYVSEKLDGSSSTFFVRDGEFGVCSRNLELKEDDKNILWQIAKKYNLKEKMLAFGGNFAIQGETIGPKIQGGKYKISEPDFYMFSMFDINVGSYLGFADLIQTAEDLGVKVVPIIMPSLSFKHDVDYWVEIATRKSNLNPDIPAEGIVVRSIRPMEIIGYGHFSFKVINPEFELKF